MKTGDWRLVYITSVCKEYLILYIEKDGSYKLVEIPFNYEIGSVKYDIYRDYQGTNLNFSVKT